MNTTTTLVPKSTLVKDITGSFFDNPTLTISLAVVQGICALIVLLGISHILYRWCCLFDSDETMGLLSRVLVYLHVAAMSFLFLCPLLNLIFWIILSTSHSPNQSIDSTTATNIHQLIRIYAISTMGCYICSKLLAYAMFLYRLKNTFEESVMRIPVLQLYGYLALFSASSLLFFGVFVFIVLRPKIDFVLIKAVGGAFWYVDFMYALVCLYIFGSKLYMIIHRRNATEVGRARSNTTVDLSVEEVIIRYTFLLGVASISSAVLFVITNVSRVDVNYFFFVLGIDSFINGCCLYLVYYFGKPLYEKCCSCPHRCLLGLCTRYGEKIECLCPPDIRTSFQNRNRMEQNVAEQSGTGLDRNNSTE